MNLLVLKDPIRVISAKEGLNQNKVSKHIIMLLHNSWEEIGGAKVCSGFLKVGFHHIEFKYSEFGTWYDL